jgi:serine/threonine protein kinase
MSVVSPTLIEELVGLAKPRIGDTYGSWTLQKDLGSGGNGVVWEALSGDQKGAIKIVDRKPQGEPFQRFRQEVQKHRELSSYGFQGILKVLDAFNSTDENAPPPGWLVCRN